MPHFICSNRGAKDSTGNILVLVSDDFRCFKDWGRVILEAVKGRENWVLKTANTLDESGCKLSPRNTKGGSAMYLSKVSNYEELIGKYEVVKEDGEYKLYPINAE